MIDTVVIDWNRTLFDPEQDKLMPGVMKLFQECLLVYNVYIYTKQKELKGFDKIKIYVEGVISVDSKSTRDFESFDPKSTVFIGDRRNSELKVGSDLGAYTIWLRKGKFADEESDVQPTKIAYSLEDVIRCMEELDEI